MGLALNVCCSWIAESAPGFRCFNINIDLTIEGLGQLVMLEKEFLIY